MRVSEREWTYSRISLKYASYELLYSHSMSSGPEMGEFLLIALLAPCLEAGRSYFVNRFTRKYACHSVMSSSVAVDFSRMYHRNRIVSSNMYNMYS